MKPTVNTGKVTDRRRLTFTTLDELAADAERLAAAERVGKLRCTGNWTAGQTFGHLATWINFAFDGYPPDMRPAWWIKAILKLQRGRFMRGPLPQGVRIPGIEGGTKGTELLTLDEGLDRLRRAIGRLKVSAPMQPNPIFGPMTHEQWKIMHMRHAELHLGYLHPI